MTHPLARLADPVAPINRAEIIALLDEGYDIADITAFRNSRITSAISIPSPEEIVKAEAVDLPEINWSPAKDADGRPIKTGDILWLLPEHRNGGTGAEMSTYWLEHPTLNACWWLVLDETPSMVTVELADNMGFHGKRFTAFSFRFRKVSAP